MVFLIKSIPYVHVHIHTPTHSLISTLRATDADLKAHLKWLFGRVKRLYMEFSTDRKSNIKREDQLAPLIRLIWAKFVSSFTSLADEKWAAAHCYLCMLIAVVVSMLCWVSSPCLRKMDASRVLYQGNRPYPLVCVIIIDQQSRHCNYHGTCLLFLDNERDELFDHTCNIFILARITF